ncbi:hypothetical protein BTHE68_56810 [Burkholderia sp. THE68]|uniref:type VI secretion system Vgr family protein n=1 Tax=Burkholderia sp. THE68 TaxID=758782 RepID=UPI0013161E93|nr:type VI secretion system tip protein TssI/VgrG [Burkholderia sp. THE68]BBU31947.1 hypothetical protein BTHE68_56810 [Burkholderia sp. THE68]
MTTIDAHRHVAVRCAGKPVSLASLSGREALGRLSEYRLELFSTRADIAAADVLGRDLSVAVDLPGGGERQMNGIVTAWRLADAGDRTKNRLARYEASVHPRLWLLTRASHSRFFHAESVPQIVTRLLQDYQIDFVNRCTASYPALEHCAQYRESDFDFVSRLLEREGIFYFFEHADGRHTLVLADSADAHAPLAHYETIPYDPWHASGEEKQCIYEWSCGGQLQTGTYEVNDYDFEKPTASAQQGLVSRATRHTAHDPPVYAQQEHLAGHVQRGDGERFARIGIEIAQARNDSIEGRSSVRGILPGGFFRLRGHPRDAFNREYLVTGTTYEIHSDENISTSAAAAARPFFDCGFTALRKDYCFRSERSTPRAVVAGPQTAVVVGPDGEEILTDKYGRVKVQFHWEQFDPPADAAARTRRCWVRVSQGWAGKRWGSFFLPRVGQEVLVECIEGDPDRPLVTGCLYNANTMPPFTLPANAAISTLRSNSTRGGDGYNELRFDDTKGAEQVFFHAENDEETWIKHDALANIGGDRHLKVKGGEFVAVTGARNDAVSGDSNAQVDGTVSLKVGQKMQQKVGTDHAIDAGMNVHIKAGMNVVIEAGMSITLKAGGAFVVIGPASVAVSGTPILLNSGGSAQSGDGASPTAPTAPKDADDGTKRLRS